MKDVELESRTSTRGSPSPWLHYFWLFAQEQRRRTAPTSTAGAPTSIATQEVSLVWSSAMTGGVTRGARPVTKVASRACTPTSSNFSGFA